MEERGPWKIDSSEVTYENKWIRVEEHQVINPADKPGIYGTIHFKNLAIGVVAMRGADIAMVGQYRFPLKNYTWEIPEGGGDLNTDPAESACRELQEETGLIAKEMDLILEMDLSNSVTDERAYIFLTKEFEEGLSNPDEDEELEFKWVPFEEVYQQVINGTIRDSLTVAAVLRIKCMISEGYVKS